MFALLLPRPSQAWGRLGHEIIGYIAEKHLTPQAASGVRRLLHGKSLSDGDIASWADDLVKHIPATGKWHYVDIPRGSGSYDPDRDCPEGNCVIAKIDEYSKQLADKSQPDVVRADALKFVTHFIEDATQPLHCINDQDRGGNDVNVTYHGQSDWNLHSLWDTKLLQEDMGSRSMKTFEKQLDRDITPALQEKFTEGDVTAWVLQCHADGEIIYDQLNVPSGAADIKVPGGYGRDNGSVVEIDLEKAAARLASVLNKALANEKVTAVRASSSSSSSRHKHHHH